MEHVQTGNQERYAAVGEGNYTPEMFGAAGDGATDDRTAIQAAIDAAHQSYLSYGTPCCVTLGARTYMVSKNPASTVIAGEVAAGFGCLNMRSGVTLCGNGTIKLMPGTAGKVPGALVTNWSGACTDISIEGITLDGNASQVTAASMVAINIVDSQRVRIHQVRVHNNNVGQAGGIYLRRSGSSTSAYGCKESQVTACYVQDVAFIGIQAERPDGIIIAGNYVMNTGDNGIDIEGNTPENASGTARQMNISGNILRNNKNGIFIESCSGAVINGNDIAEVAGIGIVSNRIHSGSFNNVITNNKIAGTAGKTAYGLRVINSSGNCLIQGNFFSSLQSAIKLNGMATRVCIGENTHAAIERFIIELGATADYPIAALRSLVGRQFIMGGQENGFPALISPLGSPGNFPNRFSIGTCERGHYSDLNGAGEVNFTRGSLVLQYHPDWKGYALYNYRGDGYTEILATAAPGEYLLINGETYLVEAGHTATQRRLKRWDGGQYADGDYRCYLDQNYQGEIKRREWGTL
ncbi:right-handed parallel beta-helix repeat-containing protein [Serratia rubidaea]|uniref:right-handed parallel beta-helix repeat-containing protein n=1 Tax=Serratia rubidaea TaxID=61652 RepID=UPI00242B493D|nr:right-handed parallel beta-helix repeat-containing protein [Serratia rubidaea]MCR0998447.1 right-handed parallel beta-helix repeat-containing protein [Serratia rubidaea]